MKSKDLQKLVISKYEAGQASKKIFRDLNDSVGDGTDNQVKLYSPLSECSITDCIIT